MLLSVFYILLGLVLLVKGGDFLVDGSVAIAQRAKLSPMVIGLTVIGFGTSAPELLVSTQAAVMGSPGIAIGNVVGSNIANIALILGVTSIICPIPTKRMTLQVDMPFMVLAAAAFVAVAMTGTIGRVPGVCAVLALLAFVSWQIRHSRKKGNAAPVGDKKPMALWKAALLVVVSIAAMVFGSDKLIEGASDIAMELGKALGATQAEMERLIGLSIVAVGTSLPELFASVMAARKGQTDMAIGNIIGSVTFNILSVVGVASAVCPIHNSDVGFGIDYIVMMALSIVLWIFLYTNRLLERWEGWLLLSVYVAYIAKTIMC